VSVAVSDNFFMTSDDSSVATTSCSFSVSESDSGIEFGGKSSRPTSVHYFNESPAKGSYLAP
jgi:hypothetical protein